ncbi:hypothetical protein VTI28DRAFT_3136 [Corynascus sepedonium]
MASFVFILSLFSAAVSLQPVSGDTASPRNKPILIRWEGPVFPSEPYRTLYVADINDLWNKVLDINSDWVAEMPDPDETMTNFGPRTCDVESGLATGNSDEVTNLLTQLRALNGHWTLEAKKCHRIGCRGNTGLYWCNDNDWNVRVPAKSLYLHGSHIRDMCCHGSDGSLYSGDPMSGIEDFLDSDRHAAHTRVLVGYGRCSDPANVNPLTYPFPGYFGFCRT